ncbi:A1G_07140 family DUF167 domain protein [Rickettsia prowazekii]|uniref:UPF0235 protein RP839 n=2 Tax=Rickettsia prowazekii TaxID=782 RepID=Y839_RICPR|nr:DUF167 domain-containing protein [Rickettsia prowazekii]Q9ZCC0.1 RecName: Full=UPF0235 protein RP839 [Rickettsia prowazekii str. Madrid E]EOB10229.1 hypothetical protein H376_3770 [Rickettsia prowazekii str. GvF12]ADE30415.1 hypothetical protein rpr22_CDS819 [Rickettsia prowazekii str. Rp22]AFE49633.1 hypothetical protein M9W_04065 [Rickettsia prowazekii str. Chernikova]AFE50477.1 hypothetical protein M9Y_04070 [Rickettsia prowazekii str. Katsinyian]AFE51320.1 hypothetical protein MA1_0405
MNKFYIYNSFKHEALINVKVKPYAKQNLIGNFVIINNIPYIKLAIKATPEQGKANEGIIHYLAKEWELSRSSIEIIKGHTHSLKTILIKNINEDYLNLIINAYIK